MSTTNIEDLLPDPNNQNYEKLKREHPFNILTKYANAVTKKYPGKLMGIVTESADISGEKLIAYAFYISAAIGKGYSYRLLEVTPTTVDIYPLEILIFDKNSQAMKPSKDYLEFENTLNDVFRLGFTQTLLMNLVSQVDLYNESRNQEFDWEDKLNSKK